LATTDLLTARDKSGSRRRLSRNSLPLMARVEMGFAPPGIHEAAVVRWLTWAVEALCPGRPSADVPAKMAFHVGITKVQGEGFGGAAPLLARALLRGPAIHHAVAGCQRLAVIMSGGLYDDLRTEGLAAQDWRRVPAAGAWVRG
jgi:hypothetical protein